MTARYNRRHGLRAAFSMLLLAAALRSAATFKIPGLSSGPNPALGRGSTNGAAAGGPQHRVQSGHGGDYMGPVFIIREQDKEEGLYDAFVTTGGIQEVKSHSALGKTAGQQQQQQQQNAFRGSEEDPEFFGVLVTPETVRQLRVPKSVYLNVSLSTLLHAASTKIPWLMVLHRSSYGELALGDPQKRPAQQQQQQQQPEQAAADPNYVGGGVLPGMMQVPQRRRYYGPDARQRRAVDFRYGGPDEEYARIAPLKLERELMFTMCSNFAREIHGRPSQQSFAQPPPQQQQQQRDAAAGWGDEAQPPRGQRDARIDVDAYARAAARFEPPAEEQPAGPQEQEQQQQMPAVPMTVPKRVS